MVSFRRDGCDCELAKVYLSPAGWLVRTKQYTLVMSEHGWGPRSPGERSRLGMRRKVAPREWLLPRDVAEWTGVLPPRAIELGVLPMEVGCPHLNSFRPPGAEFTPMKREPWDPQLIPLHELQDAVAAVRAERRRVVRRLRLP